jgi:DNA-binding transcriptional regulator GbsR (MarR family)
MDDQLALARQNFIQSMSRISHFWGFPKAMGAIYGAIYLSPQPVSLDDLVGQVGVTKGAVSTNVRTLERLGMVHKHLEVGDRKDYYTAETDFWKVIRGVLREREQQEFDLALQAVGESLALAQSPEAVATNAETAVFYQQRMTNMQDFFNSLDNLVAMLITLDNLRSGTLSRLFGNQ